MYIGTDIVEISRVQRLLERYDKSLCRFIFTPSEWNYCYGKPTCASFAACFAAKEAVAKALTTGFCQQLGWLSIEVLHQPNGMPYVRLDERGQALLKRCVATQVHISLSHCKTYALAMAVIS